MFNAPPLDVGRPNESNGLTHVVSHTLYPSLVSATSVSFPSASYQTTRNLNGVFSKSGGLQHHHDYSILDQLPSGCTTEVVYSPWISPAIFFRSSIDISRSWRDRFRGRTHGTSSRTLLICGIDRGERTRV